MSVNHSFKDSACHDGRGDQVRNISVKRLALLVEKVCKRSVGADKAFA